MIDHVKAANAVASTYNAYAQDRDSINRMVTLTSDSQTQGKQEVMGQVSNAAADNAAAQSATTGKLQDSVSSLNDFSSTLVGRILRTIV